jgi:uncharacterized membrane protein
MKKEAVEKSSIMNMDANQMALIAYLGGVVIGFIPGLRYFSFLVPLLIYLFEKKSNFVKKHALQSLGLFVTSFILGIIVSVVIGGIILGSFSKPIGYAYGYSLFGGLAIVGTLTMIITIIITIFSIIAMIKAYNHQEYKIPVIGPLSDKLGKILDKVSKSTKVNK